MNTRNCRPCQGLQKLTPVSIQNRAGQRSLRYRVGAYAEFFESMLAALSQGVNFDDGQVAFEQSPLRYLSSREQDDPSIALLDAWAILADVLTFYNERAVNEAFLRTANESGSLFELANLVGYTPRPGLSSSVLLSFEVEERGSEVQIPKGTPAKSTPIPGMGQTPETFETSAPFTARPSFNKIRPRLTQPQQLAKSHLSNVERIYFKGLGLRILPNDLLAVTIEGDPLPELLKVIAVEERPTTHAGPVTTVTITENPLSARQLIHQVRLEVEQFLASPMARALLTTEYLSGTGTDGASGSTSTVKAVRNNFPPETESLVFVDRQLRSPVLQSLLDPSTSGMAADLKVLQEDFAAKQGAFEFTQTGYTQPIADFKRAHSTAATTIDGWLRGPSAAVPDPVSTGPELANGALLGLRRLAGLDDPTVRVAAAPHNGLAAMAALIQSLSVDAPASGSPVLKITVQFETTNGLGLPPVDVALTAGNLKAAITTALTKPVATPVSHSYVTFTIADTSAAGSERFIESGVVFLTNGSSAIPELRPTFPDKVLVAEQNAAGEWYFDRTFAVQASNPATVYRAEVFEFLQNGAISPTAAATFSGNAAALTTALSRFTLPATTTRGTAPPRLVKFTRAGIVVAYAHRTVIIPKENSLVPTFVADELSAANGAFHAGQDPAVKINALQTALTTANAVLGGFTAMFTRASAIWEASKSLVVSSDAAVNAKLREDVGLGSAEEAFLAAMTMWRGALIQKLTVLNYSNLGSEVEQLGDEIRQPIAADGAIQLAGFEEDVQKAKAALGEIANRHNGVLSATALQINQHLLVRRRNVYEALETAKKESERNLSPDVQAALGARMTVHRAALEAHDSLTAVGLTWEQVKQGEVLIEKIRTSVVDLIRDQRLAAAAPQLASRWNEISDRLLLISAPPTTPPVPTDPADVAAVVKDVLASLAGQGDRPISITELFERYSAVWSQVLITLGPEIRKTVETQFRQFRNREAPRIDVWAMRTLAKLFGWNSPGRLIQSKNGDDTITIRNKPMLLKKPDDIGNSDSIAQDFDKEFGSLAYLDGKAQRTIADSPIAISKRNHDPVAYLIDDVRFLPRARYGVNNDATRVQLSRGDTWWSPEPDVDGDTLDPSKDGFYVIQTTKVWADAERLPLAEALLPDLSPVLTLTDSTPPLELTLNDYLPDLAAGVQVVVRGVLVAGDLADTGPPTPDDPHARYSSEVVTLSSVRHHYDKNLYDDVYRTTITLAEPLKSVYWRDTVTIHANLVEATHGESVQQVLGGGDARKPFQKFRLSRGPLTRLSAPNAEGKQEQIEVRVNQIRWSEAEHLVNAKESDGVYELRDNRSDATTTVQSGNGVHGARLPTGNDNVRADFRAGLGKAGNVAPGQINQLPAPPFGVRAVSNPLPGDGGADPDSVDQTRLRIPGLPGSMGKLVSKRDYENFALLFAGIDKAAIRDEYGVLVLTVAGGSPAPLARNGLLLKNFEQALRNLGDPAIVVRVEPHVGLLLRIHAQVRIDPRALWESVKEDIDHALLGRFGYARAQLGQAILAADVVETIQKVKHVQFVSLQELLALASSTDQIGGRGTIASSDTSQQVRNNREIRLQPNEICYLSAEVATTVQLEQLP